MSIESSDKEKNIPQGTEEENQDTLYALRFWERQPNGMRAVMIENIEKAVEQGFISDFTGPEGITENLKEKLSAYRILADEIGYEIGKFYFKKGPNTVTASIRKK